MAQHLLPPSHGSIGFKRGSPAAAAGGPGSNDQLLRAKLNHYLVLGPGQEGVSVSQQKGKCATCNAGFTFRLARIAAHFAKKGGFGVGACTQPPAEAVALSLQVFEVQKAKVQKVAGKEDRGAGAGHFDQKPPGMAERGGGSAIHEAYAQQWASGSGTGRPTDCVVNPHAHAETSMPQHPLQASLGPIGMKRGNAFISTASPRRTVPNDQLLRSKLNKFLVISPGQEGLSVSQQKGRCGTCDMSFTFRLLRIAAHFTRQVGNGVGPCTEPPAEAVALAFKVLEIQKAKAQKIMGKDDGGAGLLEQTPPDMAEGGAGSAAREANAQQGASDTGRPGDGAGHAAHTNAGASAVPHLPEAPKRSVGLKRSTATLLNDQLRSKLSQFLVLNAGQEGLSVSQQKGQCGTCSMSFTFRLLRIAAHFTKQTGKGVGPCTQPPAEAVALSLKVFEVLKATVQKAGGKESKDAGLLDRKPSVTAERGGTRAATHQAYAQWVLGTGQSFDVGRNNFFKKFIKAAIKDPQWQPEDRRTLATTRLDSETERVRKGLSTWIGEDAQKFGCTIALDAWTNGQAEPMVNVQRTTNGKEEHVKTINCKGHENDMAFLGDVLRPYMDTTVKFVVADVATLGVVRIIEHRYPWVTGLLCGAHSIDLLIKDIVEMAWAKATVASVKKSIKFIKRHRKPLAIFKSKSGGRDLLLPKGTRFGASVMMASRFKDVNLALINTVMDEEFNAYIADPATKQKTKELGEEVKRFILDDSEKEGGTWFEVPFFLRVVEPLFELVRLADGAQLEAAHLYYRLGNALKDLEGEFRTNPLWRDVVDRLAPIQQRHGYRTACMQSPVYGAALAVHPEYWKVGVDEVNSGGPLRDLKTMAERLLVDHGANTAAAIQASSQEHMGGAVGRCMIQFAMFKSGDFTGKMYLDAAKHLNAAAWWNTLGRVGLPDLASVALNVLSMVPAAAGCLRDLSLTGAAAGGKHAGMGPATAGKLTYVRSNLELMHTGRVKDEASKVSVKSEWADDEISSASDSDGDGDGDGKGEGDGAIQSV